MADSYILPTEGKFISFKIKLNNQLFPIVEKENCDNTTEIVWKKLAAWLETGLVSTTLSF